MRNKRAKYLKKLAALMVYHSPKIENTRQNWKVAYKHLKKRDKQGKLEEFLEKIKNNKNNEEEQIDGPVHSEDEQPRVL